MNLALSVDIGGTKMATGVVDENGRLLKRFSAPTPVNGSAADLLGTLTELIDRCGPMDQFVACGVGCAGPMSGGTTPGGRVLISPINIPGWREFPLGEEVERHTGLPTRIENDAKAVALGEGWVGAAVGERNYIAMVVSTGVGGGIVCDGRLLNGATGNAGHIGQIVVEPDGHQPPRQIKGVLEAEASGSAIAHITGRPSKEATTAEIARTGRLVGQAVGSVANLLDLKLAVVSGSVALGFGEPFFAAARAEIKRVCALDYSRNVRIEPGGLGDEGPLIGAGAVGFRHLGRQIGIIEL